MQNFYRQPIDHAGYYDPYYGPPPPHPHSYENAPLPRNYPPGALPPHHYQPPPYHEPVPHYGRYPEDPYGPGPALSPGSYGKQFRGPRAPPQPEGYYPPQDYPHEYRYEPRDYHYYDPNEGPRVHEEYPRQNVRYYRQVEGYPEYNQQYIPVEEPILDQPPQKNLNNPKKEQRQKKGSEHESLQNQGQYYYEREDPQYAYARAHPHSGLQHGQEPEHYDPSLSTTVSQVQTNINESEQSSSQQEIGEVQNMPSNDDLTNEQSAQQQAAVKKPASKLKLSKMNPKAQEFHHFEPELYDQFNPAGLHPEYLAQNPGQYPRYPQEEGVPPHEGVPYYPGMPDPNMDPRGLPGFQRPPIYMDEKGEHPRGIPYPFNPIPGEAGPYDMGYHPEGLPHFDPAFDPAYLQAAFGMFDQLGQKPGMSKTQKRKMKKKQKMMGNQQDPFGGPIGKSEHMNPNQLGGPKPKNPQKQPNPNQQKPKNPQHPQNPNQKVKKAQDTNPREPLNLINSIRLEDPYS